MSVNANYCLWMSAWLQLARTSTFLRRLNFSPRLLAMIWLTRLSFKSLVPCNDTCLWTSATLVMRPLD